MSQKDRMLEGRICKRFIETYFHPAPDEYGGDFTYESRYLRMSSKDMEKSKTVKEDKVNHPRHYDLPGGGQTIDVIDDMLDDAEVEGYYKGNIIKYIARYKGKGGAESLKKARWYLDKLIALKETQEEIDAE